MIPSPSVPGRKRTLVPLLRDKSALLQRLDNIALARGGRLDDGQVYINNMTPLFFIDKAGNRFALKPVEVTRQNVWSPFESLKTTNALSGAVRKRKFAPKLRDPSALVQRLIDLATAHGGQLEGGQTYLNAASPLFFIDKAGNRFPLKPKDLLRNAWSPFESATMPNGTPGFIRRRKSAPKLHGHAALMQRLTDLAKARGGYLEEGQTYVDSLTPMFFIDKGGHRFPLTPTGLTDQNAWSPHETKWTHSKEVRQERLIEQARKLGGDLAPGETYKGYATKIRFVDSDGNEFISSPSMVMNGWWSPYQAKMVRDKDAAMARLRKTVAARGGQIEDGQQYQGWDKPMWFISARGERFQMTPSRVTHGGRWIPSGGLIGENLCRQAMSHLFGGAPFNSQWGQVHRKSGFRLQLDGYNKELGVAFEYQGFWHEVNEEQKVRDKEKRLSCLSKGILLVEVNEFHKTKLSDSAYILATVERAARKRLVEVGRKLEAKWLRTEDFTLDFSRIAVCDQRLDALKDFIALHHPEWSLENGQQYERHDVSLWLRDKSGARSFVSPALIQRRAREGHPPLPLGALPERKNSKVGKKYKGDSHSEFNLTI